MRSAWFSFGWNLMNALVPEPGVFELADREGLTIYIGGADNLRTRFERLLSDPDFDPVRQKAAICHVEYRLDYQRQSRLKRMLFRDVFGYEPIFNARGY